MSPVCVCLCRFCLHLLLPSPALLFALTPTMAYAKQRVRGVRTQDSAGAWSGGNNNVASHGNAMCKQKHTQRHYFVIKGAERKRHMECMSCDNYAQYPGTAQKKNENNEERQEQSSKGSSNLKPGYKPGSWIYIVKKKHLKTQSQYSDL